MLSATLERFQALKDSAPRANWYAHLAQIVLGEKAEGFELDLVVREYLVISGKAEAAEPFLNFAHRNSSTDESSGPPSDMIAFYRDEAAL
jgi:hypothetical protein